MSTTCVFIRSGGMRPLICEGCLSYDRKLAPLNEEMNAVYFCYIHEKLQERNLPLLCWECVANIQKFISFKKKCLHATHSLNKYMIAPTRIISLSTLSVSKNATYSNIPCNSEESQGDHVTSGHNYTQNVTITLKENSDITQNNEGYQNVVESQRNIIKVDEGGMVESTESHTPSVEDRKSEIDIPFVKVEESVFEDLDGCLRGDEFLNHDGGDYNDMTAHTQDSDDKPKVKCKKVRKKKLNEEFNCSDDEPLYYKKRNKSVSEEKHKKSEENEAAGAGDAQVVSRRREKPAGVVNNARVQKKLQKLNVPEGLLEMVVLSWEEVAEERARAARSEWFSRQRHRCERCVLGFNHRHKLDAHLQKHVGPGAACDVCGVRCGGRAALAAHRRRHRLRWRCSLCGGTWSRAAVAADHAWRAHAAPAPTHTCSACGRTERTLGKLRNHIKSHSERQKCELCGKTFKDRTSLRTHLFIHRGEKEYNCPKCNKKFLFKKAMEVHLVTHDASALLYCHQCDMNFKNHMSFTQHMKYSLKHIAPEKLKFACDLCDKKFAKAARLHDHKLAVHLKVTPVRCGSPGCSFACSSRAALRSHSRRAHGPGQTARNHVCEACGKAYTTKKSLEGHQRTHTGERPFKCAACPSTFGYEAALYNHNRLVHRGDKTSKKNSQLPLPVQITGSTAGSS